jgi:phospholipid/cholesterol/gamma-HCH transport system substrate-binding protein
MDLHRKQEVTVGVLVLFGIGLFIVGTMWLRGASFNNRPKLKIVFADAGTVKRGSPVRVSGVQMGQVENVDLQDVGKVQVTISLKPEIQPKIDAKARVVSVGLAGDAAITLDPGRSTTPLPLDKPIQGEVGSGFAELGTQLADQAQQTMAGVREVANEKLSANLHATLDALQRFMAIYSNPRNGPTAELTITLQTLQRLSNRMDSSLAMADLAGTLRKTDSLATTLKSTTAQFAVASARVDTLLQRLQRGEGTVGRLMTDTLLYTDLRRTLTSFQQLVDTLRKYPGKIGVQVKIF